MTFAPNIERLSPAAIKALAPGGVLRAGVNLSNFLLVTGRTPTGEPVGVSPDMAKTIAEHIGLPLRYICYASPGELADAASRDEWDIALVGAEPQRAEHISFTPAYTEIEATYLVPSDSALKTAKDVDAPGVRIAVAARTAYCLWLERNIRHAELIYADGINGSFKMFLEDGLDALAGLRPRLIDDEKNAPNMRMLPGRFMTVQQAIGVPKAKAAALPYLTGFVNWARASDWVAELIRKHGVSGLSVASSS